MGAVEFRQDRPTPRELEERFLEYLADRRFENLGHWELNDRGEVVVSPVTGEHARMQFLLGAELERQLGGRAWGEQGIRQPDGPPLVPDVVWSDTAFFESHKSEGILPGAPRLCVEVMSASNDPEQLRNKCRTYLACGAEETWIVQPGSQAIEILGPEGLRERSALPFDFAAVWAKL